MLIKWIYGRKIRLFQENNDINWERSVSVALKWRFQTSSCTLWAAAWFFLRVRYEFGIWLNQYNQRTVVSYGLYPEAAKLGHISVPCGSIRLTKCRDYMWTTNTSILDIKHTCTSCTRECLIMRCHTSCYCSLH